MEQFLALHGLNLGSYTALYILSLQDSNELRIQELSEKLCLSKSATSRLVAKMEMETKFIIRTSCKLDNRGLYAVLTDEGIEYVQSIKKDVDALLASEFTKI